MADVTITETGAAPPQRLAWMQHVIAILIVFMSFAIFGWCLAFPSPDDSKEIRMMILTAAVGLLTGVVQYYFGSSAGSAQKTTLLSNQSR